MLLYSRTSLDLDSVAGNKIQPSTVDEEEEAVGQTISAATAGFDTALLPPTAYLYKLPPPADMLTFRSTSGNRLNGFEIVRKLEGKWWLGRVLKQASDATVKDGQRIANYRVFYEVSTRQTMSS